MFSWLSSNTFGRSMNSTRGLLSGKHEYKREEARILIDD